MKYLHTFFFSFTLCIGILGLFFFTPKTAQAQYSAELNTQLGAVVGQNGADIAESKDPRLVAAFIIKNVLTILGTVFLAYMVYAGYLWMTAAGDDEQINQAKSIIIRSTLGVFVILSAYSITVFVTTKFIPLDDSANTPNTSQEELDAVQRNQQPFINNDPLNQDINRFRQ